MMEKSSKIYIAGHTGMVGSAVTRCLQENGFSNLLFSPYPQIDLTDQSNTADFLKREKPEYVILAAAKVGGIMSNYKYRAQFLYENLMIQNNIIHHSYLNGTKKLLFLGSSCIYPKDCPQPIKEEYLLTGPLEYTNEPYAVAKIAGIKMCESYNYQYDTNFISVMPTNLFGPNDNYDLEKSHVLPALLRKMHLGKSLQEGDWTAIRKDIEKNPFDGLNHLSPEKEILKALKNHGISYVPDDGIQKGTGGRDVIITLWGTGEPYREFLYVDDLAEACLFVLQNIEAKDLARENQPLLNTHINIGTGKDMRIKDLAILIKEIVGYRGSIRWDNTKPDGTFRKLLDVSRINSLGWKETTTLEEGIRKVYEKYTS